MYCPLAGKAALFAFLLYLIANNLVLVVKIVLSLLCLICLYHLQRLMFMERSLRSSWRSQCKAMASQPPKAHKPIELKLAIGKTSNQVLYAECGKDFVDVLLSFLTLPMGTIIRLADKRSGIGSMDELFKSVEALDDEKCFCTKAGKTMLLHPRSAYGFLYHNLAVKIDGMDYSKIYTCSRTPCSPSLYFNGFFSLVKNSVCLCGQDMKNEFHTQNTGGNVGSSSGRVFICKSETYIISDDLKVLPCSTENILLWLGEKQIKNSTEIITREKVNIGVDEVLHLLLRSMVSKTPLTDVFVHKNSNTPLDSRGMPYLHQTDRNSSSANWMEVKLWFSKSTDSESTNRVLWIEDEGCFANFLLTFLTLPLGAIIKMLKEKSSMGRIDNLYKSAVELSARQNISAERMEMLLSPKLERMFGCSYQLLQIQEETMPSFVTLDCYCWTFLQTRACEHFKRTLQIMNPKWPGITPGGAFVKGCKWLVTDNLEIKPPSPVSDIPKLDSIPFSHLDYMYVTVGETEALNLLQASLISKSVLNHAFGAKVTNRK